MIPHPHDPGRREIDFAELCPAVLGYASMYRKQVFDLHEAFAAGNRTQVQGIEANSAISAIAPALLYYTPSMALIDASADAARPRLAAGGTFGSGSCFALPPASMQSSAIRRAPPLGQKPRRLQLKATRPLGDPLQLLSRPQATLAN